jgi:putative methionine-R-sulfoxide reductase with GAF domain/two-component sensor histidine kinase
MPDPQVVPLTPAVARDLYVSASLARPDRQLVVLAQRLASLTGASNVELVHEVCGNLMARDLLARDAPVEPASSAQVAMYEQAAPTARLFDGSTLVVSAPARHREDPLKQRRSGSLLVLTFERDAPFLAGRARSWNGLRALGKYVDVLADAEHAHMLGSRLRQIQRRGTQMPRAGNHGYFAVHAARDVLRFDGHCALLMYDAGDHEFEVLAHVAGDRRQSPRETFSVSWAASDARAIMSGPFVHRCFMVTRSDGATHLVEVRDEGIRYAPIVEVPDPIATEAIENLVALLEETSLVRGHSVLVFPLFQGSAALGMLVISAMSSAAFSLAELQSGWELALACVPALSRASRLFRDFRLSESVLERTAALEHDLPLEENGPLTATLSLLCERLQFALAADSVALLPYTHKRGELVSQSVAWSGIQIELASVIPTPGGVVAAVLQADEPCEWKNDDGGLLQLNAFVVRHKIGRVYGFALKTADGVPLGVVLVNWRADAVGRRGEGWRELSRLDTQRRLDFKRQAEAFLGRHIEWFADLESQRQISDVYKSLLRAIGGEDLGPGEEVDFDAARQEIMDRLLGSALDLLGGTAGVFAEPSGLHGGLDATTQNGHETSVQGRHIAYGEGVTGHAAITKEPCVIPDSQRPETWPAGVTPVSLNPDTHSECAFPVTDGSIQELLLGVFDIENTVVAGAYRERDLEVFRRIAQAASITLGLTRQLKQVQSIARLGQRIDEANLRSEEEVFSVALEEAARVTGAFAASARMANRSGTRLHPVLHVGERGVLADKVISAEEGANGAAFRTGEAVVIPDAKDLDTYPALPGLTYLPAREDTRSECAIAIQWHGQKIGVCNFEHRQPHALTPYRLYLQTVAAQICHALQQRRERDRALLEQGIDLVKVLSAFYTVVNHSIANRFTEIRKELDELEKLAVEGQASDEPLRKLDVLVAEGFEDANALLAGAAGSIEESVVVSVKELLDTILNKLRALHNRVPSLEMSEDDFAVMGRGGMLGWIFQEIVENSYTYGGRRVNVSITVREALASGLVEITIDDDGKGLSAEKLDELYDMDRYSGSRRRDGHHGLGLISAKVYLQTMNGTISSTHSPHGGLRTVVRLPRHRRAGSS